MKILTNYTVDHEEGFRALFKGGPARVLRSSPQFGFTLLGKSVSPRFQLYGS